MDGLVGIAGRHDDGGSEAYMRGQRMDRRTIQMRIPSTEITARTMEAVVQWTVSSELQDDLTMVVARRI
jgi:hypothetical protein